MVNLDIPKDKIEEAKEKLGEKNEELIIEFLEIEDYDEKRHRCCCPYHMEDTPSFIYNPKSNSFKCFGCGKNVDIIEALMFTGHTFIEACDKLFELADMDYAIPEKGIKTQKSEYKYPHNENSLTEDSKVYSYLALRGISKKTVDHFGIEQDYQENIVFPFYNENDVLLTVKYRPSRKISKESKENKTWAQPNASTTPVLFGMNRINPCEPLLIVEGEIDALSAYESGYTNVVSVPFGAGNYSWIEENFDWLEKFVEIIICADNDDAGDKMKKEVVPRLGSWRCKVVNLPKTVEYEGKNRRISDINELLYFGGKDAVMTAIRNADDTPVTSVKDWYDIKSLDLDTIDRVDSGIPELDKLIAGFFNGSLTILSGSPGSGKTSFLSQLMIESLEQDKNVFCYSGEMSNSNMASWISYVCAGQKHIKQFQSGNAVFYKVSPETQSKIRGYYKNKLFIYGDDQDNKASSILQSMTDCVRKYGCRFLILDNLTSINLECNEDSRYVKQSEFVQDLIHFAKKWDCAVLLVVHPHKYSGENGSSRKMNMYDLAGTADISNLAHRIIALHRVSAAEKKGVPNKSGTGWAVEPCKYDTIISIIKDRYRGSSGLEVGMFYDIPSRRFFTDIDHLSKQYSWDKSPKSMLLPFGVPQFDNEEEVFGAVS